MIHLAHELEPRPRLTELLEAYAELVNEIAPGFGSLDLAVVRERRRAAPNHLKRNVFAQNRCGQALAETTDCGPEPNEPIFEVIARARHERLMYAVWAKGSQTKTMLRWGRTTLRECPMSNYQCSMIIEHWTGVTPWK